MKTEKICYETWSKETKCECVWESGSNRQNIRKRRKNNVENAHILLIQQPVVIGPIVNQWSQHRTNTEIDFSLSEDNSDEDEYAVGL